eukprot:1190271-Prorocentrum_minimum.AAC.1
MAVFPRAEASAARSTVPHGRVPQGGGERHPVHRQQLARRGAHRRVKGGAGAPRRLLRQHRVALPLAAQGVARRRGRERGNVPPRGGERQTLAVGRGDPRGGGAHHGRAGRARGRHRPTAAASHTVAQSVAQSVTQSVAVSRKVTPSVAQSVTQSVAVGRSQSQSHKSDMWSDRQSHSRTVSRTVSRSQSRSHNQS